MPSIAAHANSYQDDAVQALKSSQLYVESSVTLSNSDAVTSALRGSDIGVVVLPSLAVDSLTPQSFAREILSAVRYQTLIVILEGNQQPLSVVYRTAPSDADAKAVYTVLSSNGNDAKKALVPIIEQLKSNGQTTSGTSNTFDMAGILGGFFWTLFAGIIVVVSFIFIRKARRGDTTTRASHDTVPSKIAEVVPPKLHPLIKQLTDLSEKHDHLPNSGLGGDGRTIVRNIQELFTRLAKKGTNGQRGIAEVEYVDKLTKLNEALGSNYYIDIVNHPELWDDAQQRLDSVAEAVNAVKSQLIENIKQVNASKDLEFQVVLSSLVGTSNATNVKDIYTPDLKRKKD